MAINLHQNLIAVSMLSVLFGTASASAGCIPAKGKIVGNGQSNGSTQGVVALALGAEKTKCAIIGVPQFPTPPNFKHTIVCDSPAAPGEAHDQLTLDSTLVGAPVVTEACTDGAPGIEAAFSFRETAVVAPGTGRGTFEGVEGGTIAISGNFNCEGGITMQFEGQICFPD